MMRLDGIGSSSFACRFRVVSGRLPYRPARFAPRMDGVATVQPVVVADVVEPETPASRGSADFTPGASS